MATKTEDGVEYPSSAYAYVPEVQNPSTWKLRLWETLSSKETATQVGRAVAALGPGGFRGNRVQISSVDLPSVKQKVLAAWKRTHPDSKGEDVPSVLTKGEVTMKDLTPEEIDKALEDLEGKVGMLETALEAAVSKSDRFEALSKLGDAEKEHFGKLDEDGQAAFLAAAPEVRKDLVKVAVEKANQVPSEIQKRLDVLEKRALDAETKATAAEGLAKSEASARQVIEFTKRAETELPNTPGKPEEKGVVLKALYEKLDEKGADQVMAMLKAGDEALGKVMKAVGSDQSGLGTNSPHVKLEATAREIAKTEKVSFAKAYTLAMERHPDLAAAAVGATSAQ